MRNSRRLEICEKSGSADAADNNTLFGDIITSPVCKGEAPRSPEAAPEASSEQGQINEFPTVPPTKANPFINQDDDKIDQGYDSEGEFMYYDPNLLSQEMDADYDEAPIQNNNNTLPQEPAPTSALASSLTEDAVNKLGVRELKKELQMQGQPVSGKKADLVAWLKTAISKSVPVSDSVVTRHKSMNCLDVTATWVALTIEDTPVPEPSNDNASLQPPTERDAQTYPKYGFKEQFEQQPFLGTTKNMNYICTATSKRNKKRKLSPTQKSNPSSASNDSVSMELIRGGPNGKFLKWYMLDEKSHPMDWLNALFPMVPEHNLENAREANVKGDQETTFAMSNWTIYSNLKAVMCNAGEEGHIFAGKFEPFKNADNWKMLGVHLLDGLSPSPQLTKKMQP